MSTETYSDDHARDLGLDPKDPRWIRVVQHGRMVEQNAPTVIPACPPWCTELAGHDYTGSEGWDADSLTFERRHFAYASNNGEADVTAQEWYDHGTVTLDEPTIYLSIEQDACTAEQARAIAAELLAAAGVLERITQ